MTKEEIADLIRIEALKLVSAKAREMSRWFCRFDMEDALKYRQKPGNLAKELHNAMEKDCRLIYEIYMTDLENYREEYMKHLKV